MRSKNMAKIGLNAIRVPKCEPVKGNCGCRERRW